MNVYFDNAASTMVREEAADMMLGVMRENYGNPSSIHYMGRNASGELEAARKNIADALGSRPEDVYFTSGGTESDNWAILGCCEALSRKGRHIISSEIEHDAVIQPIKKLESIGWEVSFLAPDKTGRISEEAFAEALRDDTVFASIMHVNNETGAVNHLSGYSREIKRRGLDTVLHTDAVQGFCKIPFSVKTLGADLVTVSAHKIHGPKGIGALYVKPGVNIPPLLYGGGHESGKRPGTEALPSAVGFGEAARSGRAELDQVSALARELRDYIINRVLEEIPDAVFIGEGDSPFILSLSLPGFKSEILMSYLDGEGICVSNGAACKKGMRSRVLEAMQLEQEVIDGALRLSFSRYNTLDEAEYFVKTLKKASETILK